MSSERVGNFRGSTLSPTGTERRRTSRVPVDERHELSLETSVAVQVLDISQSGVLLSSKLVLAVGDRAELHTTIGSQSVCLPIEIQRVTEDHTSPRGGARYRAGAVFGPMSVEQRSVLEQMLGAEPT